MLTASSTVTRYRVDPRRRSLSPDEAPPVSHAGMRLLDRYSISHEAPLYDDGVSVIYRARDTETHSVVGVKVYRSSSGPSLSKFVTSVEFLLTMRGRFTKVARVDREPNLKLIMEELHRHGNMHSYATAYSTLSQMNFRSCFTELLGFSHDAQWNPRPDPATGLLFIVFELGEETLRDRLESCIKNRQRLIVEDLRNIHWALVTICCGLQSEGYVHLDIKPSYLMRFATPDGDQWKLLDLDGAVLVDRKVRLEELSYTPEYAPPELARAHLASKGYAGRISLKPIMNVWSAGMCALEAALLLPVFDIKYPWFRQFKEEQGSQMRLFSSLAGWGSGERTVRPETLLQGELRDDLADIDRDMCAMLEGMLCDEPAKRLCISQCVVHRWLEPKRRSIRQSLWSDVVVQDLTLLIDKDTRLGSEDLQDFRAYRAGSVSTASPCDSSSGPGSPASRSVSSPRRPMSPTSMGSMGSQASKSCAVM